MVHPDPVHAGATGAPTARLAVGIITTTLRDLRLGFGYRPALLDTHLLLLVTAGHGVVEADFQPYHCRPGTLLWLRPGQVLRLVTGADLDAVAVQWTAATLGGFGLDTVCAPTHVQLTGEDEDAVITEVSQLAVDGQRHPDSPLARQLLRHQLAVLLLRLALPAASAPPAETGTGAERAESILYRRFLGEVERSFAFTRRVEEYAARLGCSVRTVTRACLAATGRSAKQVIDDRVALEARRLLAATDEPVATIGQRLGFSEPTNFGRFFVREVGRSPGSFRGALAAPAADPEASPPLAASVDPSGARIATPRPPTGTPQTVGGA